MTWHARYEGRSILAVAGVALTMGWAACDASGSTLVSGEPSGPPSDPSGEQTLGLRFDRPGSTTTACGEVAGVHVAIADSAGVAQTCDSMWADVAISGAMAGGATGRHSVADCLFVVAPGTWNVREIAAVDASGAALGCCSSAFPAVITIDQSLTTEFGAELNCQTVQSGGLDIFAYVNRPPTINNVTVSPSKFGATCSVLELGAEAADPEGDRVTYSWEVLESPTGSTFMFDAAGSSARFVADAVGHYKLQLEVADHRMTNSLSFPIHIVETGPADDALPDVSCDLDAVLNPPPETPAP